jgi:hypothetical protein
MAFSTCQFSVIASKPARRDRPKANSSHYSSIKEAKELCLQAFDAEPLTFAADESPKTGQSS